MNVDLNNFVWLLFIMVIIGSCLSIIAGVAKYGETKEYGLGEILNGIMWLILIGIFVVGP